jgi:gas vesicle protein
MSAELIISIVGALFGSGGLVGIFLAGRRTGVLEAKLQEHSETIKSLLEDLSDAKSSARNEVGEKTKDLRKEVIGMSENTNSRINEIINIDLKNLASEISMARQRIETTIVGLQGQRNEWDQLKADARELLQKSAIAGEATETIKHTLSEHGSRLDIQNEKVSAIRAEIQRLTRIENDLERIKEEVLRFKSSKG